VVWSLGERWVPSARASYQAIAKRRGKKIATTVVARKPVMPRSSN
jgi:hypothetical protein